MIKITNNWNEFLQAYASANSGDSSGSKRHDHASAEKSSSLLNTFNPQPKPSHVRFNSLVDVSKKFKKQKKYKLKSLNNISNSFVGMKNPLGKVDTNIQYGHNSGKHYNTNFSQTQNIFLSSSDHFRGTSEEADLMHLTYDNIHGNQGLENKENINLLEWDDSLEDKIQDDIPYSSMIYSNPICKSSI